MGREYETEAASQYRGFVKMMRGTDIEELIAEAPQSFLLLTMIALRARFRPSTSPKGLVQGEAFLGDYRSYGMSEQQYRTAKLKLQGMEFATFRATNKGTVARIIDTRVFDVFSEAPNEQITNQQRANNGQATTKKTVKNGKNDKNDRRLKETGAERPPFSAKPKSVLVVARFALEKLKDYEPTVIQDYLGRVNFNQPASDILSQLEDHPVVQEQLETVFRFLHYNNRNGWKLNHSWMSAFDGFSENCHCGTGVNATPIDWEPHVAEIDGWPGEFVENE